MISAGRQEKGTLARRDGGMISSEEEMDQLAWMVSMYVEGSTSGNELGGLAAITEDMFAWFGEFGYCSECC